MNQFIVISACYEIGRYGHDKSKQQTIDAHARDKFTKFVITPLDLIDPTSPPIPENFRFEACQIEPVDVVLFVDDKTKTTTVLKGKDLLDEWLK